MNPACQGEILGGIEYVNFAFLTQSGRPSGRRTHSIQPGHVWVADRLPGRLAELGIAGGAM
ncbi:MAG TPA: hypothetical protein VIV12_18095 [Streptosporangiaceae bacterium]